MTASASATERAIPSAGRAVSWWAVAAGVTSRAKTSSAPVIWPRLRHRQAEHEQKAEAEGADGNPGGAGDVGIDRCEEQRSGGDRDQRDGGGRDGEQHDDLLRRDPEEGAEEERVEAVEDAVVEGDEEEPERERERLERADRGRLRAEASARACDPGQCECPSAQKPK